MTEVEFARMKEICRAANVDDIEEVSDGFHTFNDLYEQRMYLFAALVNAYKDNAWKSLRHEDGEECFGGDWFVVGIDTPDGSYTYHYSIKYWDVFDCQVLKRGKHWDGHTEKDVTRLLSLPSVQLTQPKVLTDAERVICKMYLDDLDGYKTCNEYKILMKLLDGTVSVQPEITDEQAIKHLQSTGWMQHHDKQMYEMGLKEKLADDSDSYDSLIPSTQPEPEIYWGYTPTYERPLADDEIVPRLRDINAQLGGSYAIDRAIEIIEAVAERRTDE